MSLHAALLHIGQNLQQARGESFQDHPLAQFIRHRWPEAVRSSGAVPEGVWVEASAGKGRWADSPWLALLYLPITDTTQGGFYPVYLFAPDGRSVVLSLNQGITHVRAEEGLAAARDSLARRARELSDRVRKDLGRFSTSPMNLGSANKGSRLELYEWGHAFGVAYSLSELPGEMELKQDLRSMVKLYLRLAAQGEGADSDEDEEARVAAIDDSIDQMTERRRYRYHRTIERNAKLARKAKALLGTVCQVCDFDFYATYGEVGRGFIEAHHKVPISHLPEGEPVPHDPRTDFAVVCANCHRMLHRSNAPTSFDEFVAAFHGRS